jgi:hypothetical protein
MSATSRSITRRRRWGQSIELFTALLLSLGGAATTYCGYQASVWGGRQASNYGRAGAVRTESARLSNRGGQKSLVDVVSFVAWLQAHETGQSRLEAVLRERLRPEFRPVFEQWLTSDPLTNSSAPQTPFTLTDYGVEEQQNADLLVQDAERLFAAGQHANAQTDRYLLCTVIFGMALFFAGVGHQFRRLLLQGTMVAVSAALLVGGFYRVVQLPRVGPLTSEGLR